MGAAATLAALGLGGLGLGATSGLAVTRVTAPVFGRSLEVALVSGRVFVTPRGGARMLLRGARQIPVGSTVDASAGTVRVTSATGSGGATQSGSFRGGAFVVTQTTAPGGLTDLRLTGGSFASCTRAHTAAAKRLPSSVVRLLHSTVSGRFRTRGRVSSATVRGTQWDTFDRCDGTQTHVIRGVVVVHDFRTGRDTVVTAGQSFLAAASGSAAPTPTPAPGIGEARMTKCPPDDVNNPLPAGTAYTFAGVVPGAPAGTPLRIEYIDPTSQTGAPVVDRVVTGAGGAFTDTHAFPATGFTYGAGVTPRYPDDPLAAGQGCSFEVR